MKKRMRALARDLVRGLARRGGYEVTSYTPMTSHELRRAKLLRDRGVELVLDGGANRGQYARGLRKLGYAGEILSVEPIPEVFAELERTSRHDPSWHCINAALGERAGEVELYLNPISEVSSLLAATGATNTAGWRTDSTIRVPLRTIDEVIEEGDAAGISQRTAPAPLFLKLDLQGYELPALSGAPRALARACAVELEASTVPLYEGAALLPEVVARLDGLGFAVFSVAPALVDYESGRILQLDLLFTRC
jgi:FkbM family methyltransferase